MKKIYVVSSGEYSDYGIDAIFDSKDLAEKYISAFDQSCYDQMKIEEWELNPNENEVKKSRKAFLVRMDKQGNANEVEWRDSAFGLRNTSLNISFTYNKELMNCYCFANDERHAVKIANEKRVQLLANNSWGVDR